jgi:putative transposase
VETDLPKLNWMKHRIESLLQGGKLERFYRTLKEQAIRPKTPLCHEDARRVVGEFIEHYNTVRLNGAIGFVTPKDMLEGRAPAIFAARDSKLEEARARRAKNREARYQQ